MTMAELRNDLVVNANAVIARHVVKRTGTWTVNERAGTVRDQFGELVVYVNPTWWLEQESEA